ncbi:MAG: hypothetical protein M9922_04205 [Microthrixaceae bacterium]|nr:hypothetical protein [Microthrixaceae bacterium]
MTRSPCSRPHSLDTASITLIEDCTSPVDFEDLEDGRYTFDVIATDEAGLEGSASRDFTVDATGPTVEITDGPSGSTILDRRDDPLQGG